MKKGLGKGLGALLEITEEDIKSVLEMDMDLIDRDKNQPRKSFGEEEIGILADSIAQKGVIVPIILRKTGSTYTIVAGERRWRAAKKINLKTIPAVIREFSDRDILEISLIENVQRRDLNCIEEANAYKRLSNEFTMTQEEIAKSIGMSRSAVANKLRLLELDMEIKSLLVKGAISEGHGRALLAIEDSKKRKETANAIEEKGWSVRDIEKIALLEKKETKTPEKKIEFEEEFKYVENSLAKKFGTKVNITRNSKKGKITIHYYSMEGLNRILDIMKK
ncbi:MAG: ParB/RepB/Spo0J family partition protein [Clostridia bacterium]